MNEIAHPNRLRWTIDGEPPKAVLVWPYLVFHWAVQSIMPVMRDRYGTRFVISVPNQNMADRYQAHLGDQDELIRFANFHEAADYAASDENAIYSLARDNEAKYAINYMRDIIQLDRTWFTKMSGMAPNSLFGEMEAPSLIRMTDAINRTFAWSEALFEQHQIDLFLGWPLTYQDSCCTYVAQQRGILVTYPYPAKLEDRAFWASGAFTEGFQHKEAYERVTDVEPFDVESLVSPERPANLRHEKVSDLYSTRHIARDIARVIYKVLRKMAGDIRRRTSRTQRSVGLRRHIATKIRTWWFFRRFCKLCESDLEVLSRSPFVFYAFHQEPEFTVQGQAKDFNDQMAIVRQIAKTLPAGYNLVIKEHVTLGYRNLPYYQELTAFPNVLMAHPDIPGLKLVERSQAVVSLRGTVTLESALLGKPALVFVPNTEFSMLSNTRVVPSLAKLADCLADISKPLSPETRQRYRDDGARFRTAVKEISFSAPPLYAKDGSLLPPATAERAVDLLVRLNNLFRRLGGNTAEPRRSPPSSDLRSRSAAKRSGQQ